MCECVWRDLQWVLDLAASLPEDHFEGQCTSFGLPQSHGQALIAMSPYVVTKREIILHVLLIAFAHLNDFINFTIHYISN